MARTLKSDLPSGHFHVGNGASSSHPAFPLIDVGKSSRTSDFTINPPNVKIDADVKKIVAMESEKLRFKILKRLADEPDWDLDKVLRSPDGEKDNAKARLARDGRSAVISEVSKAINTSSIDHSSKYLLSNEPLYVYALSYAIYQEEVDDSEGINDRILVATENKIKTHFNKQLAKKFIVDRHINLSKEQKKQVMQAAASTHISYLAGEPAKAINKIVSKYVDFGDLNILVDKFFESGPIDPEKGTPEIRQLMVRYLVDIGLSVSKSDLAPASSTSSGGGAGPGPAPGPGGAVGGVSRTSPADEKLRESGSGIGMSGSGPEDPASELAKRIAEMDISAKKEGTSSTTASSDSPKSQKTAK